MSIGLKWVGIVLGALVALVVVAAIGVFIASESILNKTYAAPTPTIGVPTDAASIERGKHFVTSVSACIGCHGDNLGGGVVIDDPALGRIVAPNLTRGKNGYGSQLSDADFARVIRYGVLPNGRSARVMPADDYNHLSDADLGAVIAYVKSVPPVDSNLPPIELKPLGRVLLATGQLPIMIAQRIDFQAAQPATVAAGVSAEYGKYLANVAGCTGCHGPGLSGGKVPGAPPDVPPALNLTPGGELVAWTEADFVKALRTGVTPSGHQINPFMPWKNYAQMTDDELSALWLFVKSVPAKPAGNR